MQLLIASELPPHSHCTALITAANTKYTFCLSVFCVHFCAQLAKIFLWDNKYNRYLFNLVHEIMKYEIFNVCARTKTVEQLTQEYGGVEQPDDRHGYRQTFNLPSS